MRLHEDLLCLGCRDDIKPFRRRGFDEDHASITPRIGIVPACPGIAVSTITGSSQPPLHRSRRVDALCDARLLRSSASEVAQPLLQHDPRTWTALSPASNGATREPRLAAPQSRCVQESWRFSSYYPLPGRR